MSRNERPCAVYQTTGRIGYFHGNVILQLFEVAVKTVHELGVLDRMNDKGPGQVATREEVGGLYDLIGLRDKELMRLYMYVCMYMYVVSVYMYV